MHIVFPPAVDFGVEIVADGVAVRDGEACRDAAGLDDQLAAAGDVGAVCPSAVLDDQGTGHEIVVHGTAAGDNLDIARFFSVVHDRVSCSKIWIRHDSLK